MPFDLSVFVATYKESDCRPSLNPAQSSPFLNRRLDPAKLAQKDRDGRWTLKYSKAKQPTETPTSTVIRQHDIAIPVFGHKNHAGINRAHGFILGRKATSASTHEGTHRNVVAKNNTASTV